MRHAGTEALDQLEDLLASLRSLPELTERGRGVFYLRSKAMLHFHEDPTGLYADVREPGAEFERVRVSTKREREALFRTVRRAVAAGA